MWQWVGGYEKIYEVSSKGEIRRFGKNILKHWSNGRGYRYTTLSKDGLRQNVYVHREVAKAFLPIVAGCPDINHKDGNKENNNLTNLEWCTKHYNMRHAEEMGLMKRKTKFTDLEVDIIRRMWSARIHREKIAEVFNISFAQITRICNYTNRKRNNEW